jgi:hypothetical protein
MKFGGELLSCFHRLNHVDKLIKTSEQYSLAIKRTRWSFEGMFLSLSFIDRFRSGSQIDRQPKQTSYDVFDHFANVAGSELDFCLAVEGDRNVVEFQFEYFGGLL